MIEIRPIKDLRDTTEISKLCEESKEPIYITKNGYVFLASTFSSTAEVNFPSTPFPLIGFSLSNE